MKHPSDSVREAGPATGPALTGTEDEALLQALRNLWPILDKPSRTRATKIAKTIQKG